MSTPWPTHKDIQLNRQLDKYVQKGTHTIRYYKWWKLFHIGCQVSGEIFSGELEFCNEDSMIIGGELFLHENNFSNFSPGFACLLLRLHL